MITRVSRTLLPCIFAAPATSLAQQAGGPAAEFGGSTLQVIVSLILVVALLIGSLYLLKRLSAPRGISADVLRVIAGTAVGTRERVVVVQVADTWLVLGVAPGSVTPLHQLPSQATPPVGDTTGKDFAGWLSQVLARRNAN